MALSLRRLTGRDAAAYQRARLAALAESPAAFGGDPDHERLMPTDEIARFLGRVALWAAFDGDDIVGLAGLSVDPRAKRRHKGFVFTVYVAPAHRRQGLAERLLRALIDEAGEGLAAIMLTVNAESDAARRLYEKLGFRRYGTEPRALFVDGRYYDEDLMVLLRD